MGISITRCMGKENLKCNPYAYVHICARAHLCTRTHTYSCNWLFLRPTKEKNSVLCNNMKGIILSEETQTQKYKYYLFSYTGSAIPQFINFIPLSASESLKSLSGVASISSHNIPKCNCNCAHCPTLH